MKTLNTRGRIILLVVLAALPALAFTIYSSWDERVRAETHARRELTQLAKLAAQRQEQIIEAAQQTLVAISLVPSTVLNDPARCNEYLAGLLAKNPGIYHSMGIYGSDDVLICNSFPWQGRIVSPDRLYVQLAKSSGKMAIGEYQVGRVTKQQGINIGYPLIDATGRVTTIAFVAVNLANLNRMAAATPLPKGAVLTVVDRDGVVLERHPDRAGRIGRKLQNPQVLRTVLSGGSGIFRVTATDGSDRYWAYETVANNPDGVIPLRVLVSLPLKVVLEEANRAFVRHLAGILIATVLLLVAAWYGAEIFVLRKTRALLSAASRVRAGDLTARTGLRHEGEELSQVGEAFDDMTQALQQRDTELKRALQDLQEQAITDPLTGLLNRRYLREYLPRELTRAARSNASLAVIMVDVDYFKRINDTFGHEAGDLVLRKLGELLRNHIRTSDVACRFGGEEFALVMPDASLDGARQKAETIRASVKNLDLNHREKPIGRITASLGVALYPAHAENAEALLRAADEALYQAKGGGRDRVMVSGDAGNMAPGAT